MGKSIYCNKSISLKYFIDKFLNIYKNNLKNNLIDVEIIVNVGKYEFGKKIIFLGNYEKAVLLKKENINRKSIEDLNKLNTKLFINDIQMEYEKYFVPKKEGNYNIKLEFNINLTDSSFMFAECENIISINFINFDTENITEMESMFLNCKNLTNINLFSFNTKNVINMSKMFYKCYNLKNLDLSSFRVKKGTDVSKIFDGCKINFKNLYSSNIIKELNIRNFSYEILTYNYYNYDLSFKVIVIGDYEARVSRLMDNILSYDKDYNSTFGSSFYNLNVKYFDKIVNLEIHPYVQEIHSSSKINFYRKCSLAILLYSINSSSSFANIDLCLNDLKSQANPDIKIILVGNKMGIIERQ